MMLITKELMKKIPALRTQSETASAKDLMLYCKLFTPWSNWTWYIAEADFETGECFGYVQGFENELGYFDLNELKAIRGFGGLKIERDKWFTPKTLGEIQQCE